MVWQRANKTKSASLAGFLSFNPKPRISALPDVLISEGRYSVTVDDIVARTNARTNTVHRALARLQDDGSVIAPTRGFYVMVPAEYRVRGSVPAEWFIDAMMKHLKRQYYVGFLTAAAMHGAAHQPPQTFQAVTDRYLPPRDVGRVRLRFIASEKAPKMPVEQRTTRTGYFRLGTRETTAVDLVWKFRWAGGPSNVATVLKELGDLDGDLLARTASIRDRSVVRRLGWMLARFRPDVDLHWLRVVARPSEGDPVLLDPRGPKRGYLDRDWGVRANATVEPDV
jgi:predicted transcriptional regulator of viral defense system